MSLTDTSVRTNIATPSHPAGRSLPPPAGELASVQDGALKAFLTQAHGHRGRTLRHELAHRGRFILTHSTTSAPTFAKESSRSARDPHPHTPVRPPMMKDSKQLSTAMTAALSAELEGRVPGDLVADLVRAVLDESRRSAHDRGVEPTMLEARQLLERFVRARSSV